MPLAGCRTCTEVTQSAPLIDKLFPYLEKYDLSIIYTWTQVLWRYKNVWIKVTFIITDDIFYSHFYASLAMRLAAMRQLYKSESCWKHEWYSIIIFFLFIGFRKTVDNLQHDGRRYWLSYKKMYKSPHRNKSMSKVQLII